MQVSSTPWLTGSILNDGSIPVIDNDGCIVALVQRALFTHRGITEDRQAANAQLIEMAPKLLQTLRAIAHQPAGIESTADHAMRAVKQLASGMIDQVVSPRCDNCSCDGNGCTGREMCIKKSSTAAIATGRNEFFTGYVLYNGVRIQVDFHVAVGATELEKDSAFLSALGQQVEFNYLPIGEDDPEADNGVTG